MKLPPPTLLLCAPAALAAPQQPIKSSPLIDAQQARIVIQPKPGNTVPTSTRAVLADISGDLRLDAFQILEEGETSHLSCAFGIGTYDYSTLVDPEHEQTDVAVLPGVSSYGLDLVVTVGPQGLVLHEYLESVQAGTTWFTHTVLDAAWSDVLHVRTGDVDGDGDKDVMGVTTAGAVRVLAREGSGWIGSVTNGVFGAAPTAVEWLDWSACPGLEVAGLVGTGVEVRSLSGSCTESLPIEYGVPTCLTTVHEPGGVALAVASESGAYSWLRVFRPLTDPEPSLELGLNRPLGIAAGDTAFDDGADEVVFTSQHAPVLIHAYHLSGGPTTYGNDPTEYVPLWLVSEGSTFDMRSQPAVADIDRDGDLDLYVGLGQSDDVVVQRNWVVSESAQKMPYTGLTIVDGPGGTQGEISLVLDTTNIPSSSTHVEGELWVRNEATMRYAFMDRITPPCTPGEPLAVQFLSSGTPGSYFDMVFRPVVLNANGRLLSAGPDTLHGVQYLQEGGGTGTPIPISPGGGNCNDPLPPNPGGPF